MGVLGELSGNLNIDVIDELGGGLLGGSSNLLHNLFPFSMR